MLDLLGTLAENNTLKVVDLSGNHIDSDLLHEIESLLKKRSRRNGPRKGSSRASLGDIVFGVADNDRKLTEINLDGTDLSNDPNMEALCDALASNTTVSKLSLNSTNIDDTVVGALSLSLVDNRKLRKLSMMDNQITSEGCEYVSISVPIISG